MRQKGYTDQELRDANLVSDKNGHIYDRFRNRLMFPIIDVRGNVIGFGGRVMDNSTPKYLNSTDTLVFNKRKNLFAMNYAKKTKMGYIILVEGYMDAIALHQYGFDCAVASLGTSLTEDQATLLSKYTDQVVLIYDGDEAGQNATRRAIPMLEKAGLQVKVLKMRDAKDPDEYLKKFGADKFKVLLEESANRVEYQLGAIAKKYNISLDEERVKYIQECADLISTLPSPVQREVYSGRVADNAKISLEAMKLEVNKSFKRRMAKERRKQEKQDLSPAKNLQPKSRTIRYDNIRSAMAEETVIAMAMRENALLDRIGMLKPESFSSSLLGKVFRQMLVRHTQGLEASPGVLEELESEEMSHIAYICQRQQGPVNEQAFADCVRAIVNEHEKSSVNSVDELMALRNKMRESKGVKQ